MARYCFIQLTRGKRATIDARDSKRVSRYNWNCLKVGRRFYATTDWNRKKIYLHRFILSAPKTLQVDHKDGNGLNNRRRNLRVVTNQQNHQGFLRKAEGKTSQYIGVGFRKDTAKWRAYIYWQGKQKSLGNFAGEIQAARAFDKAAMELYGTLAHTNF